MLFPRTERDKSFNPVTVVKMKHVNNPRRGRSRNNGKRHSSPSGRNFGGGGGGGGEAKVRGTAKQVLDKYLALARDAAAAGNRVTSEGYLQHAEHYYRILNAESSGDGQSARNRRRPSDHEKPKADHIGKTEGAVKREPSGDDVQAGDDTQASDDAQTPEPEDDPTPKPKTAATA